MKLSRLWRICVLFCLLSALAVSSVACKKPTENTPQAVYYTVTFDSNGGSEIASKRILSGEKIPEPELPEKEGYLFVCWMNGGTKWDFSLHTVSSDLTLQASWVTVESVFDYVLSDNTEHATATLTRMKKSATRIPLPSVIGGFPVTAIGDGVFADLLPGEVGEVVIPKSITSVGERAFAGSGNLVITFEEGCALTSVGEEAFRGCSLLTAVPLGKDYTCVEAWSFADCTSLASVLLPERVERVCENAFSGCSSLKQVVFYSSVTAIEDSAFEDCTRLKSLFFVGDADALEELKADGVSRMNDAFLQASVYLYSATQPEAAGAYGFFYWNDRQEIKIWA